ncbi:hypothetical protein SKAU_G00243530 [Synaphobranchus kaupii]|uniref:Uncharacterized protein n=1 Tax=Synaphobranchus kaupii TaxID=118154 RepID=A0A9Q1F7W7_SYNKA|nr:hypothetical protein SKAU_G00243530 [Synaphobranchus kaupii]
MKKNPIRVLKSALYELRKPQRSQENGSHYRKRPGPSAALGLIPFVLRFPAFCVRQTVERFGRVLGSVERSQCAHDESEH